MPGAGFRIALHLERQFDARLGDSTISTLTDDTAYRYRLRNKAGMPKLRNLLSDLFVGESGSATA
jgi:hypothetical protein